ncbi:hypothetical protein GQ457_06G044020 [Hibiscus cannabinus]
MLINENGAWIFGFARKLGVCSSLIAEIWAVHNCLLHAWRLGFRLVELETDCLEVERLLLGKSKALPGNAIVEDIQEMLARDWVVTISRVSRIGNKVADALAISIRDDPVGVRFFVHAPLFVSNLVYEDVNGRSFVSDAPVERLLLGKSKALPGNAIVEDIREMLARDWVVTISRVSRIGNKVADALAISIRDDPVGVRFFVHAPLFVSNLVYEDVNGRSFVSDAPVI